MRAEGILGERPLRDVLLELAEEARTGILTVQERREIVAVSLLEGEVVSADALNQAFEEGLGRVLVELEQISADRFAALVAEHQAGGGRVVDLLVERGLLERPRLLSALREHVYRLCRQALTWREGSYKFYAGDEVSFEEGVTPLPVPELLARACRDLADPSLAAGGYPGGESVFARPVSGEAPALEGEGLAIWEVLDGHRNAAEVAAASGVAEERVCYLLYQWQRQRQVRAVGARPLLDRSAPLPELAEPPEAEPEAPPSPAPRSPRRPFWRRRHRRAGEAPVAGPWPTRLLGLLLMAWLAVHFVADPGGLLAPYPWLGELRLEIEGGLREAQLAKIRRAAGTFFLLHGRFPDEGRTLVDMGLLAPADLIDPAGRPLRLSASAVSWVVRAEGVGGEAPVEAAWTGSLAGDFLLDPDFAIAEVTREPPLVLLD